MVSSGNLRPVPWSNHLVQSPDSLLISRVTRGLCASCPSRSSCFATIKVQSSSTKQTSTTKVSGSIPALTRSHRSWITVVLTFSNPCSSFTARDCSQVLSRRKVTRGCSSRWTLMVLLQTARSSTTDPPNQTTTSGW